MIFLKKKTKKSVDPNPVKKKSPWKRNSWLRLNLPDDFSSTIEIPQLQDEKIQASVFAVDKNELNKGDVSPTNKSTYIDQNSHKNTEYDFSCSRNDQLINKQQPENDNDNSIKDDLMKTQVLSKQDNASLVNTPEVVCEQLSVTTTASDQHDCKQAENKQGIVPEKSHAVFEKSNTGATASPNNDNNNTESSSSSSLSTSSLLYDSDSESVMKTEAATLVQESKKNSAFENRPSPKKEEEEKVREREEHLSTEEKTKQLEFGSQTEPESNSELLSTDSRDLTTNATSQMNIKERMQKDDLKVMKRKSAQSFIPRSCKSTSVTITTTGSAVVEEPLVSRGSNSHLPVFVVKTSAPADSTSTATTSSSSSIHSEDSTEKKLTNNMSKIPTVVPITTTTAIPTTATKNVKNNSPKGYTSRLPKKKNS